MFLVIFGCYGILNTIDKINESVLYIVFLMTDQK